MASGARKRVVVVGAGPGGLAAAARLRDRGGESVEVVLISPGGRATFLAGALDAALGAAPPERFSAEVALDGVRCVDASVDAVAADGVTLGDERVEADTVIAAPGLALDVGGLPAWPRAVAAWDPVGAARARTALPEVSAGRVVVAVCSLPYRCPPAPFALAIGLAGKHFNARHMTRVIVSTPEPFPLAGVGGEAPVLVMDACAAAGVEVEREFTVDLEASADGVLRSTDGRELRYDAAWLIPPHVRARCIASLPGEGPLVAVGDHGRVEDATLYVVGDAAATNLPRAAGVARDTAVIAADGALEALGIAPAPDPEPIEASCFMFHSGGAVSQLRLSAAGDERRLEIDGPSLDLVHAREGERRRFLAAAGGGGGARPQGIGGAAQGRAIHKPFR
jgi:sulfide:quinone oxidoreductase